MRFRTIPGRGASAWPAARPRLWLVALGCALALAGSARADLPKVTVENDRISANLRDAQVGDVVQAFAEETGAVVSGGIANARVVTLELDRVPVQVALERLLGDQNFVLVYKTDGSLKALRLLGGTAEVPVPVSTEGAPPAAAPPPAQMAVGFLTQTIAVPHDGRLRGLVGGESATIQQILDIAVHNGDLSVRVEALQAGITGIETDPKLKEAATAGLERVSDETLEALVRGVAGERARELVAQVGARSRVSAVRSRAYRLLRRLVPQAEPGTVPPG